MGKPNKSAKGAGGGTIKSSKIEKKLQALHPKGRKAKKFVKQILKDEKAGQRFVDKNLKLKSVSSKLQWFHEQISEIDSIDKAHLHSLIEQYFDRFEDELEQINLKNTIVKTRHGRQHAGREASIKITLEKDRREYETCGIELPEMFSKKNFRQFKEWDGNLKDLPAFKMIFYKKSSLTKGLSASAADQDDDDIDNTVEGDSEEETEDMDT